MKNPFLTRLAGWLALLGLGSCLAAAALFFLGRIAESAYKRAFLIGSIVWFVLAAGRKMASGRDAPRNG
ncbi:MAG TPA: hypothetical protein ENO03_06515 [Candidatus Aminicenantes bacterium]|mgnify:CR=1 FL=1|nr:hypothetical protein [Candidatus Aminicenantes bacterium]HDT13993.1 hypothetical protein [Candidatus Aminicenantes bacterium]